MAKTFTIKNKKIDESSGLALSRKYNNVLWTHNDSGNAAIIYAMDFTGGNLGTFFLNGEFPRDWEDMSSFKLEGQSYLLLADSGDNYEINLSARLSVYKEPDIYAPHHDLIEPQWIIEYQYPKGKSYDVESVAVDISQNKVLLLSKRNKKIHVFELPLLVDSKIENQLLTAKRIAKLDYFKRPTAMDISADGKHAVILTYGKIYWFENLNHNSWQEIFKKPVKKIKYKGLYQPEAISFGNTAYQLFISSEKLPAKLQQINIKE
ncbi:MAG: hypothetical protein QM504_10365 [Pseudomonadota bacterium]